MKSSGSPCPYDQVSIIVLKKCPILRTALHRIIKYCWKNDTFQTEWKYAFTVLIYKRESNKEPSNFRPITLQPVLAKVYSSIIRNRMYTFLIKNKFIETNLQKRVLVRDFRDCRTYRTTIVHNKPRQNQAETSDCNPP